MYTQIKQYIVCKVDELKEISIKSNFQLYFDKALHLYNNHNYSLEKYLNDGFELWYLDIITKWYKPTPIDQIKIITDKQYLKPIKYSSNKYDTQQFYKQELKTQINLKTTLLNFCIKKSIFNSVAKKLKKNNISDYLIWHNRYESLDRTLLLPVYHSAFSGELHICSCSVDVFIQHGGIPIGAKISKEICHLCIAKNKSIDEMQNRYGTDYLISKHPFITVIEKIQKLDSRTARAEVDRIFKTTKWKKEGLLYSLIKELLPTYTIYREYSPEWLKPLRIDIYIVELNLAIEYQGKQHFEPIEIFGGEGSFKKLKERDKQKRELCLANKVDLIYFSHNESISVKNIFKKIGKYVN